MEKRKTKPDQKQLDGLLLILCFESRYSRLYHDTGAQGRNRARGDMPELGLRQCVVCAQAGQGVTPQKPGGPLTTRQPPNTHECQVTRHHS